MADPKLFQFRDAQPACRPAARSDHRRAGVPIYQTTSYVFRDVEQPRRCSTWSAPATSIRASPTRPSPCWRSASPRSKAASAPSATASGQAALHLAIATLMGAGSHIVASSALYGGSVNLLTPHPAALRHHHQLRAAARSRRLQPAIRPETRLVFAETIGNPGLEVLDLEAVAEVAHEAGTAAADRFRPSPRPISTGPSSMAPTSSCIPRPNGWAAMASPSAACSSTAAASTGKHRRQVPDPDRALCRLSRHRLRRGVRPAGLHHARPGRGPARFRRLHEPGQRLPHPAGRRDPAAAHGAPRRQCRRPWPRR